MSISNFGLYFTKLAIIGTGKKPAEINFNAGLNIVSGASDTGKSYIVQCLNYILGGKDNPKSIKESEGYQVVQVEMRTFDGKVFTLSRQFEDATIYLAECPFDEFGKNEPIKLSTKHSDNKDNLSAHLLELLGLSGKQLKINRWNETKSISFRDLAKFCLISDKRITTEESPIYDVYLNDKTVNKSLFHLLLSGKDDSTLAQLENPEFGKSRIKGKIELINTDIKSKLRRLSELKKSTEALNSEEINVQIQKLVSVVEEAHRDLKDQEQKRQTIWSKLEQQKSLFIQNQAIIKRFDMLNDVYTSDLNRLEFINEGTFGIDQLKEINCPLCDSLISKKILEPYSEKNDNFINSIQAEFQKIQTKQKELCQAITEKQATIESIQQDLDVLQKDYTTVDTYIANKLKPIHELHNEELRRFLKLNEDKAQANLLVQQIDDLNTSLTYLQKQLSESPQSAPTKIMQQDIYSDLATEIKSVLTTWGLVKEVYFNPTIDDIEINNDKRANFGNGFKAIYTSAFMIGVLQYCVKNSLKHPRFLVLDSPLTAYKGADVGTGQEDEKVSEEVQNRFYESLSNLAYLDQVQILIVDNKEPPEYVVKKQHVSYTHFTANVDVPRYGFYPVE